MTEPHAEPELPPVPPHPSAPPADTVVAAPPAVAVVVAPPADAVVVAPPADAVVGGVQPEAPPAVGEPGAKDGPMIDPLMHPAAPRNAPAEAPPDALAERRRPTPMWLTLVLAIVLLIGGVLAWMNPMAPAAAVDPARFASLEASLRTAQARIATLEHAAATPAVDPARIAAIETTLHDLAGRPVAGAAALDQRIAALEQKPAPVMPDVAKDVQTAMAGASAALDSRLATLDTRLQQEKAQADAGAAKVAEVARAAQAAEAATRAAGRVRAAGAALEAGQPIGDLPGAPPALARFAGTAPPTQPALRLSFPRFAAAAEAASRPSAAGHSFAERMWMRAQALVTVRQGDHVLVGAPAAVTLEAARARLDAGDLAGAVAGLGSLDAPAAAAMAPWKQDAQALLDARAALAGLAAKS